MSVTEQAIGASGAAPPGEPVSGAGGMADIRRVGGPIGARRLTWVERLWSGFMAAGCATMLGVGAWLNPSPMGLGTHMQLGMPPCGWQWSMGIPCPTCGMTTAVSDAAHLRVWESIHDQPFGFLVALTAAITFWVSLHGALTGSRVDRVLWWFLRPRLLVVGGIVFFAAWGYKIWVSAGTVPRLPV